MIFLLYLSASNNDYTVCIKRERQTVSASIRSSRSPREMTPFVYLIGASSILCKALYLLLTHAPNYASSIIGAGLRSNETFDFRYAYSFCHFVQFFYAGGEPFSIYNFLFTIYHCFSSCPFVSSWFKKNPCHPRNLCPRYPR